MTVKDEQVKSTEKQLHCLLSTHPDYQHIQQVPGVGPVVAAATIAAIGDGKQFKNGRQFAAWIGVTPKGRNSKYELKWFSASENLFVDTGRYRPVGYKGHCSV
jgi:transposase